MWNPNRAADVYRYYTPNDIFIGMGRYCGLGGVFTYALSPREEYSDSTYNKMQAEWNFRVQEADELVARLRTLQAKVPKRRAITEVYDEFTLRKGLNKIREENNRMIIRCNSAQLVEEVVQRAEAHGEAVDPWDIEEISTRKSCHSDTEMLDEDEDGVE